MRAFVRPSTSSGSGCHGRSLLRLTGRFGGGCLLALALERCKCVLAYKHSLYRGIHTLTAHGTLLLRALLSQPGEDAMLQRSAMEESWRLRLNAPCGTNGY